MNEIKWVEPRPLRQSANAIPFPLDALPSVLRNMAQAISVTTSTDVGMAGTAMLSAVGYCFTGLYRLAGKADHTEPPVLYSIIIRKQGELICSNTQSGFWLPADDRDVAEFIRQMKGRIKDMQRATKPAVEYLKNGGGDNC